METPTLKSRPAVMPLPLERRSNTARKTEGLREPGVHVFRSPPLRPEEFLAIVAAGRRR